MASPVEDQGAQAARSITPSDTNNVPNAPCRALWVGGAGDVALIAAGDADAVTIVAVTAGTVVPIRTLRVMSTNTDATDIVALY